MRPRNTNKPKTAESPEAHALVDLTADELKTVEGGNRVPVSTAHKPGAITLYTGNEYSGLGGRSCC